MNDKILTLAALLTPFALSATASADVIASTTFDGRALTEVNIANDTATGLNWTVTGVEDPGDMTTLNAAAGGLALFNGNALVQNMFAPAINTGNGNTFWTTNVNLTVLPGATITLTDITFDSWSVNAGQNQNVDRRSDFTFTLSDQSGTVVGTAEIIDSASGTTGAGVPAETATFDPPLALTAGESYTLEIKGGDFAGFNETGNHTALDNLSINGDIDSDSSFTIREIDYDPTAGTVSLTWESNPGENFSVKFSNDLISWDGDLDDDVPADKVGETTTETFDLASANLDDADHVYFRVEINP